MAVEIFIVAHSDDWFLFMGNTAADAVADPRNTIVFVYVTAANFVDGTNVAIGTRVRLQYETGLRAREDAAIAAALACCGLEPGVPRYFPLKDAANVKFDIKTINGRDLAHYEVANTRHYCLRLADGLGDGSGVAWNGNQSLRSLRSGAGPLTAQGDLPARYDTWGDLTATLRGIFDAESGGQQCRLNFLDPQDSALPGGAHSDHQHVGLAVQDAAADEARYQHALFLGYRIANMDVNLNDAQQKVKRKLLDAWNGVQQAFYPSIDREPYTSWALRQYPPPAGGGRRHAVNPVS